jgi:hypothetical protein
MAGSSDQMKEQLAIYQDTADPLDTLPPFGGAEAKPQNSEITPDLPPDLRYIAQIVEAKTGDSYPLDGPWQEPKGLWVGTLERRKETVLDAYKDVHKHYVDIGDTKMAIATGIFIKIYPAIADIAISQLKQGYHGPKSWHDVNPKACNNLVEQIDLIRKDPQVNKFLDQNSSIREYLNLIKNVLIPSNDPEKINIEHSKYMKHCINANAKEELVFYAPFGSDFTNPAKDESEMPQICEAIVSLVVPMDGKKREKIDITNRYFWQILKERKHTHQINRGIDEILGYDYMGAGLAVLSATVGEAFVVKSGESHEHGFYLALNNLEKKRIFWQATKELAGGNESDNSTTFINIETRLHSTHEQGHRLTPEFGIFGEIPTDIPSVISNLKVAMAPELIDETEDTKSLNTNQVVRGILTEFVSETINSVSEKAWFEGRKSNTGNDLFDGYLLSGVMIVNAVTESGVAKAGSNGEIILNTDSKAINKLIGVLEDINEKFHDISHGNNRIIRKRIKDAIANPEAEKIIALYREKIDKIQARKSTLPLQTESRNDAFVVK